MDVRYVPTIRKPIEWFKDNPENYQSHEENGVIGSEC